MFASYTAAARPGNLPDQENLDNIQFGLPSFRLSLRLSDCPAPQKLIYESLKNGYLCI